MPSLPESRPTYMQKPEQQSNKSLCPKSIYLSALRKFLILFSGKPGNAVPSIRKLQSNPLKPLTEAVVPNEEHAVRMFEAQGGQLQREWRVGRDLLTGDNHARQQRKRFFLERHSFENIFTALVSGNPQPFKNGLKYFMRLTYSM